jgi:hypothetical protein
LQEEWAQYDLERYRRASAFGFLTVIGHSSE